MVTRTGDHVRLPHGHANHGVAMPPCLPAGRQALRNRRRRKFGRIGLGCAGRKSGLAANLVFQDHFQVAVAPQGYEASNRRIFSEGLGNCTLSLMDAQNMSFVDGLFDKVAAMYIASVVPNPQDMVSEIKRVCKTGGDLLILNHFTNCNRLISASETILSPLARIIGFRPVFPMEEFISETSLDVVEINPVNAFGFWSLIHAKNI